MRVLLTVCRLKARGKGAPKKKKGPPGEYCTVPPPPPLKKTMTDDVVRRTERQEEIDRYLGCTKLAVRYYFVSGSSQLELTIEYHIHIISSSFNLPRVPCPRYPEWWKSMSQINLVLHGMWDTGRLPSVAHF